MIPPLEVTIFGGVNLCRSGFYQCFCCPNRFHQVKNRVQPLTLASSWSFVASQLAIWRKNHPFWFCQIFWATVPSTIFSRVTFGGFKNPCILGKHTTSKFEVVTQGQPFLVFIKTEGGEFEFAQLLVEAQDMFLFKKLKLVSNKQTHPNLLNGHKYSCRRIVIKPRHTVSCERSSNSAKGLGLVSEIAILCDIYF